MGCVRGSVYRGGPVAIGHGNRTINGLNDLLFLS
jgi:hypothetical protein